MPKFYVCTTAISFVLGVIITLIALKRIEVNMLVTIFILLLIALLVLNEKTGILEKYLRKFIRAVK
jgi:hypothetical protein